MNNEIWHKYIIPSLMFLLLGSAFGALMGAAI